jgi:hypothetical protein
MVVGVGGAFLGRRWKPCYTSLPGEHWLGWGASGGRPAKAKSLGKVVACWAGWREKAAGPGYGVEEEGGPGRLLV